MQVDAIRMSSEYLVFEISADEPLLRVKNPESQSKNTVVHIDVYHLLAQPQESYLISLYLSCFIYKIVRLLKGLNETRLYLKLCDTLQAFHTCAVYTTLLLLFAYASLCKQKGGMTGRQSAISFSQKSSEVFSGEAVLPNKELQANSLRHISCMAQK